MPEQVVIDGLEFARAGKSLSGNLKAGDLERLQDSLASSEGELEFTLRGQQNPNGRPMLHLAVRGTLQLRCQRCLGVLAHSVDIASDLLLLRDESEFAELMDDEDDSVDGILAAPKMDVAAIVEDEIVLSLPYAPRHPVGGCGPGGAPEAGGGKASPFATLAKLKK
ncbi:MAG TPA: YceD family protein [Burkholderiales bacterium]|nr:YceD family protein [Burkholderiales bacterium]